MSYSLSFEINALPPMSNQLLRGGWRVKHANAKKWKRLVALAVQDQFKPSYPLSSAALELIRVSSVEPDFDGLVSGFKAVIDGLVEIGVLATDKMSCIGQPKYRWQKCKRGEGKVIVKVEVL